MPKFFLKTFVHFQYDHRFLFSKEMRNIRMCKDAKRYVCKNLLNLDCQERIRFGIYQVAYK